MRHLSCPWLAVCETSSRTVRSQGFIPLESVLPSVREPFVWLPPVLQSVVVDGFSLSGCFCDRVSLSMAFVLVPYYLGACVSERGPAVYLYTAGGLG